MRRRKKEEIEDKDQVIDAEEEGLIAERWSTSKILIGAILFCILFGGLAYGFLYYKRYQEGQGNNILGIQENRQEAELPTEEDVEETIETVQKELDKINPGDVFSSQESIQKIIKDLESLRKSTQDPKATICEAVCGNNQRAEKSSSTAAEKSE